jgi:hypothetical protein
LDKKVKSISNFISRHAFTSSQKIINDVKLDCHPNRLSKQLKRMEYRIYYALRRLKILNINAERRLKWALDRRKWEMSRWNNILWRNESSFEFNKYYRQRVWRKKG